MPPSLLTPLHQVRAHLELTSKAHDAADVAPTIQAAIERLEGTGELDRLAAALQKQPGSARTTAVAAIILDALPDAGERRNARDLVATTLDPLLEEHARPLSAESWMDLWRAVRSLSGHPELRELPGVKGEVEGKIAVLKEDRGAMEPLLLAVLLNNSPLGVLSPRFSKERLGGALEILARYYGKEPAIPGGRQTAISRSDRAAQSSANVFEQFYEGPPLEVEGKALPRYLRDLAADVSQSRQPDTLIATAERELAWANLQNEPAYQLIGTLARVAALVADAAPAPR